MSLLGDLFGVGQSALNYKMQQQTLNYQKELQQQIFQREDNAVQRRAADLKAAGLSKTLAAGSAAGAGAAVDVTTPQLSGKVDPLASYAQAVGIQKAQAEIRNIQSVTENNLKQNQVMDANINLMMSQKALNEANTILSGGRYELLGYQQDQINAWIDKAVAETDHELIRQGYTRAQVEHMNIENNTYSDLLNAKLAGIILQNQEHEMRNTYMGLFGTSMPAPTTFGKMFDWGKWSQTDFYKDAILSLGTGNRGW